MPNNPAGSSSIKSRTSFSLASAFELSASALIGPDPGASMAALTMRSRKYSQPSKVETKAHEMKPPLLETAPYPLSYDRQFVSLDVLDHVFLMQARKCVSWMDFGDRPPSLSLDLGCGTGAWILDAAKEWKECRFIGFDIANIQPDLGLLPPQLAQRIQWVHGDFLKDRLPFEDNTFDHVHAYRLNWGVPEAEWDGLLEEIVRVLRPGGVAELAEEDIIFPTLPRSYTLKGKQARPSAPYPRPSLSLSAPPSPVDDASSPKHSHALLESLFFGVFESRMINTRPTSIVPHHVNIHFRNVQLTPTQEFPFPPPPLSRRRLRHIASDSTTRPRPESHSSQSSVSTIDSDDEPRQQPTPPASESASSLDQDTVRMKPHTAVFGHFKPAFKPPLLTVPVSLRKPITTNLNERNLALHLNGTYQRIIGCKEAMWTELHRRLIQRRDGGKDLLHGLGWDDEGDEVASSKAVDNHRRLAFDEHHARARFEEYLVHFERDMRYRTALADVMERDLELTRPIPAPLTKYERQREEELEMAIKLAARQEAEAEGRTGAQPQCSRSFRGFLGFKDRRMSG
ncbi:S-adenosyl-L-methionine-dependent methyltransferase [Hysterangium stoloniferum]|nr:S-adenosyl-L-methionine-dependent methyltransferase [Hysterangium stoloniferum]